MTSKVKRPPIEDNLQWKTTSNGRQPPIEEYLQILKVEYISNHCMDHDLVLMWEIREKLRGNLECGSAQPSLSTLLTLFIQIKSSTP